jgi:proteasome lid subunit RPN8/RPN11
MELPANLLDAIRDHGREAYPEECCGALLGQRQDGAVSVVRIERLANAREGDRRRRYVIAPDDYVRVEESADRDGLSLVGFYHSHPDHPAVPSEYDREHALPFFHYLVLTVAAGDPGEATAWILEEDRNVFIREELVSSNSGGPS